MVIAGRMKMTTHKCSRCNDTGIYETGNNDFPCSCPAGLTAKFNVGGSRLVTGAELRKVSPVFFTDLLPDPEPKKLIPKWNITKEYHGSSGFFEAPVVEFDYPTDAKKYAEWLNSLKITRIVNGLVYNVKRKKDLPRNLLPGTHYSTNP